MFLIVKRLVELQATIMLKHVKIIDDFGSTLYSFSNSLSNTTMYLMQGCKWSVGVNFSNLILLVRRARNIAYNSLIYTIRC